MLTMSLSPNNKNQYVVQECVCRPNTLLMTLPLHLRIGQPTVPVLPSSLTFDGKTALVTGANVGLGLATCLQSPTASSPPGS